MPKWLLWNSVALRPEDEGAGGNGEIDNKEEDSDEWQTTKTELLAQIAELNQKLEALAGKPDQTEAIAEIRATLAELRTELTELKAAKPKPPRKSPVTPKPLLPNPPPKSGEDDPPAPPAGRARRKVLHL